MSFVISLTPNEEARLADAASQEGLAPAEFAEKIVKERITPKPLPPTPLEVNEALDAKLRQSQQATNTPVGPHIPASVLFAQWAEEDAKMTDEEREAEARLWEDIEKSLLEDKGLRLRLPSE